MIAYEKETRALALDCMIVDPLHHVTSVVLFFAESRSAPHKSPIARYD
jgi:hypothetical protein